VNEVSYLQEMNGDARPTKHKENKRKCTK